MTTRIAAQHARNSKVDITHDIAVHNHEIAGMKIGVEHSMAERVAKKIVDQPSREQPRIEIIRGSHMAGISFPEKFRNSDALQVFSRKNSRCSVAPEDQRDFLTRVFSG